MSSLIVYLIIHVRKNIAPPFQQDQLTAFNTVKQY